jgi:uncharacterized membrane protein
MSKLAIPVLCLAAAYAFFFGYIAATYNVLPAKMACHFDAQGHPNGWMGRFSDIEIITAAALIVPTLAVVIMACAHRIPMSFLNVPHRDYWMAPERRSTATGTLLRYSIWFAAANVLFMTGVHALTVEANGHTPADLNLHHLGLLTGLYLAVTAIWLLLLLRRFSRMP